MGGVNELPLAEEATGIRTTYSAPPLAQSRMSRCFFLPDHLAGLLLLAKRCTGRVKEMSRDEHSSCPRAST